MGLIQHPKTTKGTYHKLENRRTTTQPCCKPVKNEENGLISRLFQRYRPKSVIHPGVGKRLIPNRKTDIA
jgi:hypothetical protein